MTPPNPELEALQSLKRAVDCAIDLHEMGMMHPMSETEYAQYLTKYGVFDFIIGDFGIKRISGHAGPIPAQRGDKER